MKKISILLSLFLFALSAFSQKKETGIFLKPFSLDDAIEHALHNSPELNIQRLKERQEREELAQTRLDALPEVYGTSDMRRNLIIPRTPIPAHMIDPSAPEDELMYMRFNTPWSSGAGLNVTFDLFNPETAGKRSEQKKQLSISRMEVDISENALRAELTQAYIDCAIARSQVESTIADTIYFHTLRQEMENLFQLGKIPMIQKNLSEINHNAAVARYLQAENILHDAQVNLLNRMGEESDGNNPDWLNLSDDIESLYVKLTAGNPSVGNRSLSQSKLSQQLALSQLKTRHMKLRYLPTISLTGYYGANYFGRDLQLGNGDKWFGNSFVALSLHIPISQSISTSKGVSQLRLQEMIDHENLREFQNNRNNALSKELAQLENLTRDYLLKHRILELRIENLSARGAEKQKGYIPESDFQNEKQLERNARREFLQAAYEVLSAHVRIDRLMKE